MGTQLFQKNGIAVNRFYGGQERGVCYQITIIGSDNKYYWVQLTEDQFKEFLAETIKAYLTK